MTNMSYSLHYCMSAWYIFVTNCMSELDIAGFCACLCCTSLCFQTTYFRGLLQCWTPVVYWFSPLHRELEVPRSISIHVCEFFDWFCLDLMKHYQIIVQVFEKKTHNDAKKKKTVHYQIAIGFHMLPACLLHAIGWLCLCYCCSYCTWCCLG